MVYPLFTRLRTYSTAPGNGVSVLNCSGELEANQGTLSALLAWCSCGVRRVPCPRIQQALLGQRFVLFENSRIECRLCRIKPTSLDVVVIVSDNQPDRLKGSLVCACVHFTTTHHAYQYARWVAVITGRTFRHSISPPVGFFQ